MKYDMKLEYTESPKHIDEIRVVALTRKAAKELKQKFPRLIKMLERDKTTK